MRSRILGKTGVPEIIDLSLRETSDPLQFSFLTRIPIIPFPCTNKISIRPSLITCRRQPPDASASFGRVVVVLRRVGASLRVARTLQANSLTFQSNMADRVKGPAAIFSFSLH